MASSRKSATRKRFQKIKQNQGVTTIMQSTQPPAVAPAPQYTYDNAELNIAALMRVIDEIARPLSRTTMDAIRRAVISRLDELGLQASKHKTHVLGNSSSVIAFFEAPTPLQLSPEDGGDSENDTGYSYNTVGVYGVELTDNKAEYIIQDDRQHGGRFHVTSVVAEESKGRQYIVKPEIAKKQSAAQIYETSLPCNVTELAFDSVWRNALPLPLSNNVIGSCD